jgi:hypothetical protein
MRYIKHGMAIEAHVSSRGEAVLLRLGFTSEHTMEYQTKKVARLEKLKTWVAERKVKKEMEDMSIFGEVRKKLEVDSGK